VTGTKPPTETANDRPGASGPSATEAPAPTRRPIDDETSSVTTSDGTTIAVHDLGGTGEDLLLAHATGFHGLVLAPLARALGDRFSCTSFDERGHGDSGRPADGSFHWEGFATDALAVVDALGMERPFGFGHSAGGAALILAELARPGTFSALYCFEPIILGERAARSDPVNPLSDKAGRRREQFRSREEAFAQYATRGPLSVFDAAALRAYVDHGFEDLPDGGVRLKCRGADESRVYSEAVTHDVFARLGELSCPVTVACGGDTDSIRPEHAARLAERIPDGRLVVIESLGHFAPMQDPEAVARSVVRAFAATTRPPRPA
jgi:pimeloyl-ACP methyl ester carboxylesterase